MCEPVCGGQKLVSGVFLHHVPFSVMWQGLLLDLDLINLASLANQIFLVNAVIGDLPHPPSFCRAMEVINSTPSVCTAST